MPHSIPTCSSSAAAAAACAPHAWRPRAAPASCWRRPAARPGSAAPASTSAASRRSSTATRPTTPRPSRNRTASAGRATHRGSTGRRLKENRRNELARLNGVYRKLLVGSGVEVVDGHARLLDAHTVEIDCAGTARAHPPRQRPAHPDRHRRAAAGARSSRAASIVLTSNEMFDLEPFPARLLVIGGGYIACEFASIFNGLGSRVTQLYRGPQVLRGFDDDVRRFLGAEMVKKGVDLRLNANVAAIERDAGGAARRPAGRRQRGGRCRAVRHGPRAERRGPRARDRRRRARRRRRGAGRRALPDQRARPSIAVGDVTARVQLTPGRARRSHGGRRSPVRAAAGQDAARAWTTSSFPRPCSRIPTSAPWA